MKKLFFKTGGIVLLLLCANLQAQTLKQTIRGTITDVDSKTPLVGVTLYLDSTDPLVGTITDNNGNFAFKKMPVGRYTVIVNYIGYESKVIPNILLGAGKEVNLSIEMTEEVTKLEEVVVTARKNKGEPLNEMASVSARSFTVEETQRFAGSFNDPARMASSYAGVMGSPDGNNEIIIRGNSPRGLQWRIEGVPVPNPNHYAEEGATGGPISILNSSTLANSDFFTGAFPAEFGNAYSGVFDINLRKGNNYKREYSIQAGVIGFDATAEGPFSKNNNGSYLFNVRYSSLAVLTGLGIKVAGDAVPKFSDFTFNTYLPTKNNGSFQVFGVGGTSSIRFEETNWKGWGGSSMAVVGLNHIYPINPSTYVRSGISYIYTQNIWEDYNTENNQELLLDKTGFNYHTYRLSTEITKKFSARHTIKTGVSADIIRYDLYYDDYDYYLERLDNILTENDKAEQGNAYFNYKFRPVSQLTFNAGVNVNYLNINQNTSVEPRIGARWQMTKKQALSAGFGMHSKSDNISLYLAKNTDSLGVTKQHNLDLDFAKAYHYIIGYENRITKNLNFKMEAYYQDLYNVPISADSTSSFSILNATTGYINDDLTNNGTGYNVGVEMTLEKFFADDYYFMITGSLFDSKYTGADGVERNTRFNNNYIGNVLIGKEWKVGHQKNNTIACNIRTTYAGGQWYSPLNTELSERYQTTYRPSETAYSKRRDNFFRTDLKVSFRRNLKNTTRVWELDIQNVSNTLNVMGEYYDTELKEVVEYTQLGILPTINYRIEF